MSRYALVIGISQYKYFTPLKKTAAGATKVAQLLRDHGEFEVEFFPRDWYGNSEQVSLEGEVSIDDFLEVLSEFKERVKGHTALFYFSGHGFLTRDRADRYEAYLAMTGSQVQPKKKVCVPQNEEHISLDELGALFLKSHCNQLIVWLDCCHSGAMMDASFLQEALSRSSNDGCDYSLMTACRNFESAYEGGLEAAYTVFTGNLVQALERDVDPRGVVSSGVLYDSVFRALKGSGQEPRGMNLGRPINLVTYPGQIQISSEAPAAGKAMGISRIGENPYRGLEAFQETDAALFFGRETAIGNLLRRLLTNRFLAVVGASGSGKSSLVKAGLIPKLKQEDSIAGSPIWAFLTVRPAAQPASVLLEQLGAIDADMDQLVVIDQFEEVFTVWDGAVRSSLMALINGWLAGSGGVRLVITMRAEFLDLCHDSAIVALINQSRNLYIVQPLTAPEIEAAIVRPTMLQGATVEVGLASAILTQVLDQPGILPLLQYTLQQLWAVCIEPGDCDRWQLRLADYEQLGGVTGSLNARAEGLFQQLSGEAQQLLPRIFVEALVQSGEESVESPLFVRQRALWGDLAGLGDLEQVHEALDPFVEARLLVSGDRLEVAHEAILTKWERLFGWLMASREPLRLRKKLAVEYHDWVQYGRSESELLQGALLEGVLEKVNLATLPEQQRAFVVGSRERRDWLAQREVEQERKLRKLAEARTRGAIASAVVVGAFTILAGWLWRNAAVGEVNALLSKAQAQFGENRSSLDSLVSALKVEEKRRRSLWVKFDPKLKAEVLQVLQQSAYWVRESNRLENHSGYLQVVRFSPDGQLLATATYDGFVHLWNISGQEVASWQEKGNQIFDLQFSPDGSVIATGGTDGKIRLRKISRLDNQTVKVNDLLKKNIEACPEAISSLDFNSDRSNPILVSAGGDCTIKLWRLDGQLQTQFERKSTSSVQFSPDNTNLLLAGSKGVELREIISQKKLLLPSTRSYSAVFSPDGKAIAFNVNKKELIVLERQTAQGEWTKPQIELAIKQQKRLVGHDESITGIEFSPDSQTLATSSHDDTVRIWDRSTYKLVEILKGHQNRVTGVSFNHKGTLLASGSEDRHVKIWKSNSLLVKFPIQDQKLQNIAISSDGSTVAMTGRDDSLFLWRPNGKLIQKIPTKVPIYGLSFSPITDKQPMLAFVGADRKLTLTDFKGEVLPSQPPQKHQTDILTVAFSRDSSLVATGDDNAQIWMWLRQGAIVKPLFSFKGHKKWIDSLTFSAGNTVVSTDFEGQIGLWNTNNHQLLRPIWQGHENPIYKVSTSPDGKFFATASADTTIKFWNFQGENLNMLSGHNDAVRDVQFSPTQPILASSSDDRTIRLWKINGDPITTLMGHDKAINGIQFTSDGNHIISVSDDKTALSWEIKNLDNLDRFFNYGCAWAKSYIKNNPEKFGQLCRGDPS
jgi:WD40 repeat protein/energy-coupling factor transporter ATP-binding protein EcfA2